MFCAHSTPEDFADFIRTDLCRWFGGRPVLSGPFRVPLLGAREADLRLLGEHLAERGYATDPAIVRRRAIEVVRLAYGRSATWWAFVGAGLHRVRSEWATAVPFGVIMAERSDAKAPDRLLYGPPSAQVIQVNPAPLGLPEDEWVRYGREAVLYVLAHELMHWVRQDVPMQVRLRAKPGRRPMVLNLALDFMVDNSLSIMGVSNASLILHEEVTWRSTLDEACHWAEKLLPAKDGEPAGSEDRPDRSTTGPAGSEDRPGRSTTGPAGSEDQPGRSDAEPADSKDRPGSSGAGPAGSEDRPGRSTTGPADGGLYHRTRADLQADEGLAASEIEAEAEHAVKAMIGAIKSRGLGGSAFAEAVEAGLEVEADLDALFSSCMAGWRGAEPAASELPDEEARATWWHQSAEGANPAPLMPGFEREASRTIAVILDTSGSMTATEMGTIHSLARQAELEGVDMIVLHCGSAVHRVEFIPPGSMPGSFQVHGRDGTDLREAFKMLDGLFRSTIEPQPGRSGVQPSDAKGLDAEIAGRLAGQPVPVVVITDGETPWPGEWPHGPVLVVLTSSSGDRPKFACPHLVVVRASA